MARNYDTESDEEEPDFFEEYDEAIKARVKSLKKIEDATDAKALIALSEKLPKTKFKIYDNFQKKAKKLWKRWTKSHESLLPKNCEKSTWHHKKMMRPWCVNTVTWSGVRVTMWSVSVIAQE